MTKRALFVTGMQRSGTTLLQRLLDGHPELSVLSQPFPLLFVAAKREFLRRIGCGDDERYPLGHRFLDTRYRPAALDEFLAAFRPSRGWLREHFARMEGYSGQYTRHSPEVLARALDACPPDADFATAAAVLWRALGRGDAAFAGGKETLGEELMPYLLDRDCRCLLVVRDPRDVLASLDFGAGPSFAGRPKPVLFDLRNWRKSVAYALALDGRPGFHWLRYEDLVGDPEGTLEQLATRLCLPTPPPPGWCRDLRAEDGSAWPGNSSHARRRGIDSGSVGAYRDRLPPAVVDYVEATCWPELRALGYAVTPSPDPAARIAGFRDPFDGCRPELAGYSARPENVAAEARRLDLLMGPSRADAVAAETEWFLLPGVRERLRAGCAP